MVIVFSLFFFFLFKVQFFHWEFHTYFTKLEHASDVMLTLLRLEEEVLDLWLSTSFIKSLPGVMYVFFFYWCKTEIQKWLSLSRWFSNLNINLWVYREIIISCGLLFLDVFNCGLENNTEELLAPVSDSCWGQGVAKQGWAMKVWQRSRWTVIQPL